MIGYLSGRIIEAGDGTVLLAVGGEAGSVGYSVSVPATASYESWLPGEKVELYVYTHVREEALDLYGFATKLEKELFLTLLSVNGIGPKSALGICSNANPQDVIQAIIDKDKAFLTKVPGVGKKTAERVVLELSDSVAKRFQAQVLQRARPAGAASRPAMPTGDRAIFADALSALLDLGMREHDAAALLNRALEGGSVGKVEDLVKIALKEMSHGVR